MGWAARAPQLHVGAGAAGDGVSASVCLAGWEVVSMWAEGDSVPRFSVCPLADTSGSRLTAGVNVKT